MLTEIILTAKIGSFVVMRMPCFKFRMGRQQFSYAEILITDIDYEIYKTLKYEDKISVSFGYRSGVQAEADFTITHFSAIGKDMLSIFAIGEEYPLLKSITESFNDEQPSALIRHIASLAGLGLGTIDVTDEPIPHIIFSGCSLFEALHQLRNTLLKNGGSKEQEFWVYDKYLHWGTHRDAKATKASVYDNILSHRINSDGMNIIELPLIPHMKHSETVSVSDGRRGKQGEYTIHAVSHEFDGIKTRTLCEYR